MGQFFEVLTGAVTNPGAVLTPLTMAPNDTLSIRSFDQGGTCQLLEAWSSNAAGGALSIRSPNMHDNLQGVRLQVPAGNAGQLLPRALKQRMKAVDNLGVLLSGGGAEVDLASLLLYYNDPTGPNGNYRTWDQIVDQIIDVCGVEIDLTSGATAGQYGGGRTLNQDFQNLKADYSYAVLGYTCASAFGTLGIRGSDTGNVRVGGPGLVLPDITADWFVRLTEQNGLPMIPVIKANNQGATTIDLASTDTATSHHVSLIMARLNT